MVSPCKIRFGLFLSWTLGLCLVPAQNKNEALNPNASLPETIDWLTRHIPYSHVVPMNKERGVLQREAIGHFRAKGCTVSYEVTTETLEPSSASDNARSGFTEEQWRIELDGLNPQMIRVEAAKGDRPARLVFTSFDPHNPDLASKMKSGEAFISVVEPPEVIWHSTRSDGHAVRNGEGFVSWGSFSVRTELKGQAIAEALKHGVGLCRQTKGG